MAGGPLPEPAEEARLFGVEGAVSAGAVGSVSPAASPLSNREMGSSPLPDWANAKPETAQSPKENAIALIPYNFLVQWRSAHKIIPKLFTFR
jgi:hypothetical protein